MLAQNRLKSYIYRPKFSTIDCFEYKFYNIDGVEIADGQQFLLSTIMLDSFKDSLNNGGQMGIPHHGLEWNGVFFPISSRTFGFILNWKMGATPAQIEDERTFQLVEIIGHDHVSKGYVSWKTLLSVNAWQLGASEMIKSVEVIARERKKQYTQTFLRFD